jgi:hypothetical protein
MKKLFFAFTILVSNTNYSQNLLPNPSFESFTPDPTKRTGDNLLNCIDWISPSGGTPDYYIGPRTGEYYKLGQEGNSFIGLANTKDGYHEYIEAKLNAPLIKDKLYCLSMYVSQKNVIQNSVNEIDYCFSNSKILVKPDNGLSISPYNKVFTKNDQFSNKSWEQIHSCYKASGTEEYIIIGIFNSNIRIVDVTGKNALNKLFYLFIDNVNLVPIDDISSCPCYQPTDFGSALNKPLTLKNINFESGKNILLSSSYQELNRLVGYLKTNGQKIEVMGHTDNDGNENENQKLSEARAKAVSDYIIKSGIEKERVKFIGYGSKKPLKPNDTEENKLINRRVEVRITN